LQRFSIENRRHGQAEENPSSYTLSCLVLDAFTLLTQAFNIAKTVDGEDDQDKATLLNDLAIEFAKVGLDQQAFQVIQAIDSERKASEAYDLASYYLKNAQYDKVQQVVEVMRQMGDLEWVNFTLSDLAQKYIEQKRYDEALKIANSLDVENQKMGASFSTGSESRSGKLGVLTYLASAYAKNGKQQKSNELFDTVFKLAKTADPSQMAEVAITYYETTGDLKRPIELVDQAWQKINQNKKLAIKEPGQVKFELDSIATSYSLLGQYEKTMQALFQARQLDKDRLDMLDRFGISDPSSSDGILSSAAIRLSYKGQFEEAIKFVNSIKSNKEKDKTFSTMAQNIAAIKHYEQAFQLINEISDVVERDRLTQLVSCAKEKQ
jgi:tetratricopeptide (TPR) repeat protein